jgi:hypothetical protein
MRPQRKDWKKKGEALEVVLWTICMAGLVALYVVASYFESQTYNRLTGAHTTWWDAMWVELRVQDVPKHD